MASGLDQLRLQLLWNRLIAVVEEQAQTLIRTAFSTTVREAGDLSAGVFDTKGRMLAQAVTGTPGHVNAMAASVGAFLRRFPLATLEDGDVLITNDPWAAPAEGMEAGMWTDGRWCRRLHTAPSMSPVEPRPPLPFPTSIF